MTNLSSLDLNLLRVLDALLQERSTVRAGQRLGLSQPAVSAALARLRHHLGDELLFRRGQGMEPTVRALAMHEPLRRILQDIEALVHQPVDFDPTRSDARFKISGSDFFAELLMPRLAERLGNTAPGMRVHLVDLVPDSFVDTIERYNVDIALVPRLDLPDWIESQDLFRSTFSVIARKEHPRLQHAQIQPGDAIPLDLFCDLGHVLFSPQGNAQAMGDTALAKVGRTRRVAMTMPVFSGVYRAVAGSDLIALMPTKLARHVAPTAGLSVFSAPIPIPVAHLCMIWHRRFSSSPAHHWLREQITDLTAPLDCSLPT